MKGRVTITVDKDQYDYLITSGVNCSALADEAFGREAKRLKAERWKEESRASMAEYAEYVKKHGSFADQNRSW